MDARESPRSTAAARSQTRESTLYPKTGGHLKDTLLNLRTYQERHDMKFSTQIPFTGTVKLHGTHADIRIAADGTIIAQSRNVEKLSPEQNNFGFAGFCVEQRKAILALSAHVKERWQKLHPHATAGDTDMILAGEWIGQKIQVNPPTAIMNLSPRRFVLCALRLNSMWECIEDYADIHDEAAGLLNISKGGFFHVEMSLDDEGESFMNQARELTKQVYETCPFGRAVGLDGAGEGLVWTPSPEACIPNKPAFWLKTKGEQFLVRESRVSKETSIADKVTRAKTFAEMACGERRLEQGWDFLRETNVARDKSGLGSFLSWVAGDISTEERTEIDELGIGDAWKRHASRIAIAWYLAQVDEASSSESQK